MIINNLNLISISFTPFKTNPPLVIDADGPMAFSISYQGVKFIAWVKPYNGGIIMILGALLLGSFFVYHGDFNMSMVFGIPVLLIGLSFIASVHRELV